MAREARKTKLAMTPVKTKRKPREAKAKSEDTGGVQIDHSIEVALLLLKCSAIMFDVSTWIQIQASARSSSSTNKTSTTPETSQVSCFSTTKQLIRCKPSCRCICRVASWSSACGGKDRTSYWYLCAD